MKILDKIRIRASPQQIWHWFENIERMKAWNSKLISFRPISNFSPGMGYLYQIRYRLSRNETEFTGEITQFDPGRLWSARFTNPIGQNVVREMVVHEIYEIVPDGDLTIVNQTVIIENSRIPWFIKLLIKWISTGRSTGKDNLYTLKRLAEKDAATRIE
jgi:hypothetical protein